MELITLDELQGLKRNVPEMVLTAIDGRRVLAQDCDEGVRFGYVAYGFCEEP